MAMRRFLLLTPAVAALLVTASALVAVTATPGPDEAAIKAAAVQDVLISVYPWIPCTNGRAAVLSAATVQAQQARMAAFVQQTYAPAEPTYAAASWHLQGLVSRYGPGGSAVAGGDTLCEPSGGVDAVQVLTFTMSGATASITIQAHEWNETTGTHNGAPFHFKPSSVITKTDEAVNVNGHWLISKRGDLTFLSGAP